MNQTEPREEVKPPSRAEPKRGAEDASTYCPICFERLGARSCKLVCPSCGYYMSCSDFY
ncbi:MAG: hypothetical protein ACRD4K_15985 [Candidatus Acidiferrales bacterium]